MWPRSYFAAVQFAPAYFPQSQGLPPAGGGGTNASGQRTTLDLGLGIGSR